MLVKIETTNHGTVWVNPKYVTDVHQLYTVSHGTLRVVNVESASPVGKRQYMTLEDMDALAERLTVHVART
jgi:hypothetical protein